jgi:hypothetical protein
LSTSNHPLATSSIKNIIFIPFLALDAMLDAWVGRKIQIFEFPSFFWLKNKAGPITYNVDPAHIIIFPLWQKKRVFSKQSNKQNRRRGSHVHNKARAFHRFGNKTLPPRFRFRFPPPIWCNYLNPLTKATKPVTFSKPLLPKLTQIVICNTEEVALIEPTSSRLEYKSCGMYIWILNFPLSILGLIF